jgi:hypothetical protein
MRRHALVADSQRDAGFNTKPEVIVSEIRWQRIHSLGRGSTPPTVWLGYLTALITGNAA